MTPEEFAGTCKALGHPARIKILSLLLTNDCCVCGQIAHALPLAQSTVSEHLRQLREGGMVTTEARGHCTCYRVNHRTIRRFKKSVVFLEEGGFPDAIQSEIKGTGRSTA